MSSWPSLQLLHVYTGGATDAHAVILPLPGFTDDAEPTSWRVIFILVSMLWMGVLFIVEKIIRHSCLLIPGISCVTKYIYTVFFLFIFFLHIKLLICPLLILFSFCFLLWMHLLSLWQFMLHFQSSGLHWYKCYINVLNVTDDVVTRLRRNVQRTKPILCHL